MVLVYDTVSSSIRELIPWSSTTDSEGYANLGKELILHCIANSSLECFWNKLKLLILTNLNDVVGTLGKRCQQGKG